MALFRGARILDTAGVNYLAHLLLADDNAESLIGNLSADFVNGDEASALPPLILQGIRRHHAVDTFTDSHPVFLTSRRRIDPGFRHYRGLIADVFYDHFLALHWHEYHARPMDEFVAQVYARLTEHLERCPPLLQQVLPRMIRQNWLGSYGTPEGIATALRRISRRTRGKVQLETAVSDLVAHREGFDADFREFFPQLVRHVRG